MSQFTDRHISLFPAHFESASARATERQSAWADSMPRRNTAVLRMAFSVLAGLFEFVAVVYTAISVEALYHAWVYHDRDWGSPNLRLCLFVAVLFVVSNAMRTEYSIANYLRRQGHGWRVYFLWNVAFLCSLAIGFLTKSFDEPSRAGFALFYVFGFVAAYVVRKCTVVIVNKSAVAGGVSARRVFLVGFEEDIDAFIKRYEPSTCGLNIVAAIALRNTKESLADDLTLAAASARMLRPDDIFILTPWSRTDIIDSCVNAFLRVPAEIHLGPERVLDRFADARIEKFGSISSLSLSGHPLNIIEVFAKRSFDVVGSVIGLTLLSPVFLLFAALIKLDSKGPVFFLQRRYGFNQEPFNIVKFRSMTTMDNGREIVQAKQGDSRITRIGGFMRRYNIDELPQLLNVLRGDMSLVGPRPHALVHDQLFERKIALYARRHNVKPGITGWAQVNGLRGEIDTPEKIRQRVEHDLYYIDNWTILLDIWIILLTVFSKKAYRNAV